MTSGYSNTPLLKKLGLKEDHKIRLINPPDNYFELLEIAKKLVLSEGRKEKVDFIHCFVKSVQELEEVLPQLKNQITENGMIWVSWHKKSSDIPTDVTEDIIRNKALSIGLVDVKVCAIDDLWSGLKLVIPVKNRK